MDPNATNCYTTYGDQTYSTREAAESAIERIYDITPANHELFELRDDPLGARFNRAAQAWVIFYRPYIPGVVT